MSNNLYAFDSNSWPGKPFSGFLSKQLLFRWAAALQATVTHRKAFQLMPIVVVCPEALQKVLPACFCWIPPRFASFWAAWVGELLLPIGCTVCRPEALMVTTRNTARKGVR